MIPKANLLRSPVAVSRRASLVSGTWYTPSATRPTQIYLQGGATGIGAGDDLTIQIEVRDTADATVSAFTCSSDFTMSVAVVGTIDIHLGQGGFILPANYDYRIVDNSTGTGGAVTVDAIEAIL